MKNINAVDILKQCIDQISKMTDKEFQDIKKNRGMVDKNYNINEYINEDICIILPSSDIVNNFIHKETLDYSTKIEHDVYSITLQVGYEIKIAGNYSPTYASAA